jgi:hypothetical protein
MFPDPGKSTSKKPADLIDPMVFGVVGFRRWKFKKSDMKKKPRDEPRAGLKRLRNNPCCDKLSS